MRLEKLRLINLRNFDKCSVPIYHASAQGKSVPLLKTLVSSHCGNGCLYCPLRSGANVSRLRLKAEEIAEVALYLWERGFIEGVFLSSGVDRDPDEATSAELEAARALRERGFNAYLHLRLMPGTSVYLLKEAAQLAERAGINVEAPAEQFEELCPDIDYENDILRRLKYLSKLKMRVGADTQLVVGASDETDAEILKLVAELYELGLRRVYFSPFQPVKGTPLEARRRCNPARAFRLYQASFLLRDYPIRMEELLEVMREGMLPLDKEPKLLVAQRLGIFPLDLASASWKELCLLPGFGPKRAKLLVKLIEEGKVKGPEDLYRHFPASLVERVLSYLNHKPRRRILEWL